MHAALQHAYSNTCLTPAELWDGVLQVQHHLVWVWGDASPNAQLECLSKQPAIIEQLQHEDQVLYLHPWYESPGLDSSSVIVQLIQSP